MNKKITFNIIFFTVIVVVLLIFGTLVYRWYNVILSDTKSDHQNQQLAMSRISAVGIETFFNRLIDEMDAWYYSSNNLENIENLTKLISSDYINKEDIKGIYYLSNIEINVIIGNKLTYAEAMHLGKIQSSEVFLSEIYSDSVADNDKYFFFCKNYRPDLRNGKVLFVKIYLNNLLDKYVLPIKLTKSDYAWVLDSEGSLIYHRSHQEMLLNNIFESKDKCRDCHSSFEMQKNMLVNKSGVGEYIIADEPTKIMAYSSIKFANTYWFLAISTFLSDINLELQSKLNFLIINSAFIFLIILGLSFLNYRTNLKRLLSDEESKRISIELKYQEELNHVSRLASLGEFVDTVVHEVNTPIGIIAVQVDAIKLNTPDNRINNELDIIKAQISRISRHTKSLLNYSKRLPYNPQETNILNVLNETLYLLGHRFHKKKIKINLDHPPSLPTLLIDRVQIEQVLLNILNNACDAINENGTINISLAAFYGDLNDHNSVNGIVIKIKNTGNKIPEDILGKIFEPFFTTKQENIGAGLGLSISKKIIIRHQGKIEVENSNDGPVFIIKLPLKTTTEF